MVKKAGRLIALALVVAIVIGSISLIQGPLLTPQSSIKTAEPNIGNLAPDFGLVSLNGDIVSLSEHRGKPVVLNFWASWCPYCAEELEYFEIAKKEFGDSVVILTVNRGEPVSTQRQFLASYPSRLSFNFLIDSTDSVAKLYDVSVMPTTFFIDANGIITNKKLGQVSLDELKDEISRIGGRIQP